MERGMTEKGLD